MKGKSNPRLPHLRPAHPHLRVRGCFLSENAAMPPGEQVKVHKSASFVDILEVCKFRTFCDRKGYRTGNNQSWPYRHSGKAAGSKCDPNHGSPPFGFPRKMRSALLEKPAASCLSVYPFFSVWAAIYYASV